jgi:hypothetical protein
MWFSRNTPGRVRCQDTRGRRHHVQVWATEDGQVAIALDGEEPMLLSPLDVGRLRHELRAAVVQTSLPEDLAETLDQHNALRAG